MEEKIALVEWIDAWFTADEMRVWNLDLVPKNNHTVGWVVSETDEHIMLAQDKLDFQQYRHWFFIPKPFIKKVTYLSAV